MSGQVAIATESVLCPEPVPPPAPCPPQVRALGLLALGMGLTLPALAALALRRYPQETVFGWVAGGAAAFGGLLLLLGGAALTARARWGRIPLWIFAWGAWPAGVLLSMAASVRVAEHGAPAHLFLLTAGVGLGVGIFAFLLGRSLLFGPVALWTDGAPQPRREGPPVQSSLALVSLILALVPPWGLGHAVSLLLGILAIGRIRRARGALHGRGMAMAGVCVSSGVFLLLSAGLGVAAYYKADVVKADAPAARRLLEELAVLQRLHGELDRGGDGRACTTTLTALLDAAALEAGPLDAGRADALRAADYGVRGGRATPLAGYVFRLETTGAEIDGEPQWTIAAYPWRDARAPALAVDDHGEPWESGATLSDRP